MKSEFKTKFLQHLLQNKKEDEGFTLIELLVVIIIIGILAAIALPSFLNQANKAKQSESRQYVGSMNRAQQAYYVEKSIFATDIGALGLGIQTVTANYLYGMSVPTGTLTTSRDGIVTYGSSTFVALKSYVGGVQIAVTGAGAGTEATALAVLCEEKIPTSAAANAAGVTFTATTGTGPFCNNAVYQGL